MVKLADVRPDEIALAVYEACAKKVAAEDRRRYLGMSQIGKTCERYLWLDFNQGERAPVEGRMARVFANGHGREEAIIADLEAAGFQVIGRQTVFEDYDGKFGGHCDGVIIGVTKSHDHILEIKTANDAAFKAFVKNGAKHKPEYLAQMQCYMGYSGLERALFVVENKNNQELYTERIYFDQKSFEDLRAKARRIIEAETPPAKPENDGDCFWCPFKHFSCQNPPQKASDEKSGCRGCRHFFPAAKSAENSLAIVEALRVTIKTLRQSPEDRLRLNARVGEALVAEMLKTRPDLFLPTSVFYGAQDPISRFEKILEYVLSPKSGYCEDAYLHGGDVMTTSFNPVAAAQDWCAHTKHKAAIYQPIGCGDREDSEVPF